MPEDLGVKIEQLEQAVAAQERLRGVIDDAIIDATIAALRAQIHELQPPESEQQRKLMTILFVDIAGSTNLLSDLDPEENLALMDSALQQLAEPVQSLGGRVLRFMGDGYLAVFGLPSARENDPEMAVRAGLQILEVAQDIAKNLEKERHLSGFNVRVGANTGLVVAGGVTEGEDTIMGPTVNLAKRLESSAPPGGLLISQNTYQHVRGLFDFEPGEVIQAKGFEAPVQVYLVKRARPRAFRLTNRGVEGVEIPMIGRQQELRSLQEALKDIELKGGSRFVTIVGEAGLGKSRLLAEFETWLNQQEIELELLKGRASLETLDLPRGLLRDLIANRVGILDDDPTETVRTKIVNGFNEMMGQEPNLERKAHFVGEMLGYDFRDSPHLQGILEDPQQIRDRALLYLADYFKAAADRPLVIFLEDVHWADGSSLEALLQLYRELSAQRVLVVALTRPMLFERRPSWANETGHLQIDVRPLTREESQQLVREVLYKVEKLPDQLRDLIIKYAEGNPFYLEELIRMLVEDGVIVKDDPSWHVRVQGLEDISIPQTLTGVIQARLDGLPEKERRVLQRASVIGRVFWDEAVCYLDKDAASGSSTGLVDAAATKHNLGTLQTRELIYEQTTSAFSDSVEYLFKHAVLREVTYESVLKRMRRIYHALAADWLIAHSGERKQEVSGLIAGHLEKADKVDEALKYLQQAAEAALSNYAPDEAAEFYSRAIALTPTDDLESQYTLVYGRMKVFDVQGNRSAQRADLDALTSLAHRLDDDEKRAEVLLGWAWFSYYVGEFSKSEEAAEQVIELAEPARLYDLAGQAHSVLAWAGLQTPGYDGPRRHAQQALDLARKTGNRRIERISLVALGSIDNALGSYSTARVYQESALAVAREIGDPVQEAVALANLGVNHTLLGDYSNAQAMYQQLLDISRDTGDPVSQTMALVNLGWVSAAQGYWEMARDHALAGVNLAKEVDYPEPIAEGLVWLGHAWLGLEQPQKAAAAYSEALDLRRALNQKNLAMGALAGLARAALVLGDLDTSLSHVNEILASLAEGVSLDGTWEPLQIYLTCVQVLQAAEDERLAAILEEAYNFLRERAVLISNEDDRKMYLENVPWHREITAAWESRQQLR